MYMLYQTTYTPRDIMREIVCEKTQALLKQEGLCCCDACCSIVAKYAMHDLPVMRATCVVEDVHIRFALLEQQAQANILVAILKAIKQTGGSSRNCAENKSGISAIDAVTSIN